MSATCCADSPNCSALIISDRPSRLRSLTMLAGISCVTPPVLWTMSGSPPLSTRPCSLRPSSQRHFRAFVAVRDVIGRIHDCGNHGLPRLAAGKTIERRSVVDAFASDAVAHPAGDGRGGALLRVAAQLRDVGHRRQRRCRRGRRHGDVVDRHRGRIEQAAALELRVDAGVRPARVLVVEQPPQRRVVAQILAASSAPHRAAQTPPHAWG